MPAKFNLFLFNVLLTTVLLTACGEQQATEAPEAINNEAAATVERPQPTEAPIEESAVSDVADEAPAQDTDTCDDGLRSIDSAYGPTCIPVTPERIVALDEGMMTNLLALDVTPTGVLDYANRDFTQYLGDTTAEIASVGTPDGPNFEAILALEPDLILGMDFNVDEEMMETLEQIAPTAISAAENIDWRSNFLYAGEATGKLNEAEALLETTNTRLEAFRTAYADQAPEDETIAVIRSRADNFNIYYTDSFISELTEEVGLQMPDSFDDLREWNYSLESITLLTSDKLFVMVRNEDEAGMFQDMNDNPLWQTLPAAQNDEVYLVNWSVWIAGWNIIGANLAIDDLFFYMLDEEAPTPNPFSDLIIDGFGPQYDEERLAID
ncbi:MAG: iron-siderophore ABC transporter substrate-binding protein [Chloroflexota bacterium]